MNISNLIIYFITGGLFTTIIVVLEESGQRTLSGLATLIPVFTLVAYFFIGQTQGSVAVMGGIFLGGNVLILIFVVILTLNAVLLWQVAKLKNYFLTAKIN